MKKISALLLLLIFIIIPSCEKDDICAETTPTTPKLILRFYDITSQDDTKNVTDLRVTGFDENNEEVDISNLNIVTTDSINLPLRTDANVTKFVFYKDYTVDGLSIKEIMEIQHSKESAVKQRLRRGRENLAEILGANELNQESSEQKSQIILTIFF